MGQAYRRDGYGAPFTQHARTAGQRCAGGHHIVNQDGPAAGNGRGRCRIERESTIRTQIKLLKEADAVFIGGGETFVLLAELHRTGQLEIIQRRVAKGMPYGGSSAGANVAGLPTGETTLFSHCESVICESISSSL